METKEGWLRRRDALRARIRERVTRRKLVPPPMAPLYDDVFFAGLAALDALDAPQPTTPPRA